MRRSRQSERRGAILALVALCLLPLMTFVALSVDLGLMAVARTECQNAADSAAMAGARTLNGDTSNTSNMNNYSNVAPKASLSLSGNTVLTSSINSTSQLTLNVGRYTYNSSNQKFEGQFPGPSTENWSMVRAKVNASVGNRLGFAKVFNFTSANIQTTATAAHRPRDVAVILDYSGSMRFGSLMGKPAYTNPRSSNNGDTVVPTFGHYSSSSATLTASSWTNPYAEPNVSAASSDGRDPVVEDFYTSSSGTAAWTSAGASLASNPGGQIPLKSNLNTGSYAQTLASVLNLSSVSNSTRNSTFESQGYAANGMIPATPGFQLYTQGPNYWGKTFFIWPPDPSTIPAGSQISGDPGGTSRDWRRRYFNYPNNSPTGGIDDNSLLWGAGTSASSCSWRLPGSSSYQVDYDAILFWIKNHGPNPFPSRLQAGRILYYDSIPSTINTSSWPPSDMNQRFWKDYIDFCLGFHQTGSNTYVASVNSTVGDTGYGPDYGWGSVRITAKSSLSGSPAPYMRYDDNPPRPRLRMWFGPLSMVDFLGNYNLWYRLSPDSSCSRFCWWPGTCHESPMYACKLGIRAALADINNNHPNDLVSMIMFSVPMTSANDDDAGRFNRVRVPLSRNYANMQESLWYPPSTIGNSSATVRPYDSNNLEVPRAMGGTCYSYPLMLAYNQFSTNTSLQTFNTAGATGDAGGNGRKGAQKIVIFETDGAPNTTASATFQNNGAYNSFYRVRFNAANVSGSDFPTGVSGTSDNDPTVVSQITSICQRICALDTASNPGFSQGSKPVQIHCIGFGPLFAPSDPNRGTRIDTLNQMQQIGSVNDGMPDYKLAYGTESQVVSKLQQAFTQILQSGVQVSLIE